jgi:hypothetical protein
MDTAIRYVKINDEQWVVCPGFGEKCEWQKYAFGRRLLWTTKGLIQLYIRSQFDPASSLFRPRRSPRACGGVFYSVIRSFARDTIV